MFSFKKPYFLGVDFGTSSIRAIELTVKDGRPYLTNYGEVLMDNLDGKKNVIQFQSPEEKVQIYFKALMRHLRPEAEAVNISIPGFSGLITLIELPQMKKEDLEQAIQFEARRYIPAPLKEVVLSWDVNVKSQPANINSMSNPNGTIQHEQNKVEVLLVAALHKEVAKYERFLVAYKMKINLLELETFSLVRSLIHDKEGLSLIIDIGARSTNLILVENGMVKVNRNVNSGGQEITSTLAESLNVSVEKANILKTGEKDFINNKESSIVFSTLEVITNEAQRMLTAFRMKNPQKILKNIVLSGGAAKMKGMDTYFSQSLSSPVIMGNPWNQIAYDEKVKPFIDQMGSSYSVAIGLALAGFESYERS